MAQANVLQQLGIQPWYLQESLRSSCTASPCDNQVSACDSPAPTCDSEASAIDTQQWDNLQRCVANCTRCPLHQSRNNTVFGDGNQQADLLIIGEAPGANEDQQGLPFVGRAGLLLNAMLKSIGLARQSVYIANILKCRPPNNRDPKAEEVSECLNYLQQQIQFLQPKLIVTVGRIAAQNLLQRNDSLSRMRGNTYYYCDIPVMVTYHPAYLLRSPQQKKHAYKDLLRAQAFLA